MPRPAPQIAEPVSASASASSDFRKGVVFALVAQTVWGVFPIYLKMLSPTPAMNIVAHRVIWSFVLLLLVTFVGSLIRWRGWPRWAELRKTLSCAKTLWLLLVASVLIAGNWLGFVWAISLDRAMDASVGYYICPQVVVILGVLFQKERLSRMQWIAFAVTSVGVLVMAASKSGFPWLGLVVAFSFGFYALVKKRIDCPAMTSLTVETYFLFLPAMMFLMLNESWFSTGVTWEPTADWVSPLGLKLLLLATGVTTVLPLVCYVTAVKYLPLSMVGVLQFVGPTIQFALSVFAFGEPLDSPRLIGILLVWVGVAFFLRGGWRANSGVVDAVD